MIIMFAFRNYYILNIDKKSLHGSDKFMMKYYKDDNKSCYLGIIFKYNVTAEEFINNVKILKNKLENLVKKKKINEYIDSNNIIRINHNLTIDDIFIEKNDTIEEMLNNNDNLGGKGIFFVINYEKSLIYAIFNHVIYDGYRAITKIMNDTVPFYKKKNTFSVNKPKYYFVFTEIMCFYYSFKLINSKKRQLSVRDSIKTDNDSVIHHKYSIEKIKDLKITKNIKTLSVLISFFLKKIFNSLKKKKEYLKVCILGAFENERFNNNYTFINLTVKNDSLDNITKFIDEELRNKRAEGLFNYYISNTFDFIDDIESTNKTLVDVLFSPVYFLGEYESNNIEAYVRLQSCSLPIYIGCLGDKKKVTYNSHIRTDDIDLDKFKKDSVDIDF